MTIINAASPREMEAADVVGVNTMVPACPEGYVVDGKKDEADEADEAEEAASFASDDSVEGCIS